MKRRFIVNWRMYGCVEWCSVRVVAFSKDDAFAVASRQLNNHMIQLGNVTEVVNGVPTSSRS